MASPQLTPGPPTSIDEQISLLQQRGMSIPDVTKAERFLSNVNYYRLRGYLEPFVDKTTDNSLRPFRDGATFDAMVERHNFDTRLRTLLLEAFNYIEVSIRTQWSYHLSYTNQEGQYSHLNPNLFSSAYSKNLATLKKDYQKYGKNLHYYDFNTCPIWAISEVMSLGQLSRWHIDTNLEARKRIACHYGLPYSVFGSVLRHLVTIRNFSAHHELLWDRNFITKFRLTDQMEGFQSPRTFFNETETGKLYNTLVMIAYLTGRITGNTDWTQNLVALMNHHPKIPQDRMGFVPNWQQLDIWHG